MAIPHDFSFDTFVAKVSSSGSGLDYCGYIGGSMRQIYPKGIAVDGLYNAYVTGYTSSTEATFPVIGGPDLTYNGGLDDAFVAKVNDSGSALVYCGYIGGSSSDYGYDIAVDASGNAYIVGDTSSGPDTFPVIVGPSLTLMAAKRFRGQNLLCRHAGHACSYIAQRRGKLGPRFDSRHHLDDNGDGSQRQARIFDE